MYLGKKIILLAGMTLALAFPAEESDEAKLRVPEESFASKLEASEEAGKLVVVIGNGKSAATVSYHEEDGDGFWKEVFTTPGVYGKNGASSKKEEGDGRTPVGTYSFTMAFGLRKDPGSALSYHRIRPGDYWVDDPDSRYYNKLVNTKKTKKAWKSAENMSIQAPYYNYGLVINYNEDCVPGKGSAIFIHCTKSEADTASQGCVRIPEERMKQLIRSVDDETRIVIASDKSRLVYK